MKMKSPSLLLDLPSRLLISLFVFLQTSSQSRHAPHIGSLSDSDTQARVEIAHTDNKSSRENKAICSRHHIIFRESR